MQADRRPAAETNVGSRVVTAATVVAVAVWLGATTGPELLRDRIYPFDSALYGLNGALFLSLFEELSAFVAAPLGWFWDYYNQYPALFLRRHPPLFSIAEAGIFAITGVSVFGAKLTVLLFSCLLAFFSFLVARRMWGDRLLAAAASLLIVSAPLINEYMRSVWLDVPALAFGLGAVYFYLRRLQGADKDWRTLAPILVFSLLSLYTYQLTFVLIAAIALHMVASERPMLYRQPYFWWTAGLAVVLLAPLVLQGVMLARDNIAVAGGAVPAGWERFAVDDAKLSLAYWGYYPALLAVYLPVAAAGAVLWALLWAKRSPSSEERLLFLWLVCAFLVFSWFPAKNPRYGLYLAIPALWLAIGAIRTTTELFLSHVRMSSSYITAAAVVIVVAIGQASLSTPPFNYYLSHMDRPVRAILAADPSANIFYAGRFDAAFVFYLRRADTARMARVHRATVQLERPEELARYVADRRIGVLAYEIAGADVAGDGQALFAAAIEGLVAQLPQFSSLGRFPLEYAGAGIRGRAEVQVYARPSLARSRTASGTSNSTETAK